MECLFKDISLRGFIFQYQNKLQITDEIEIYLLVLIKLQFYNMPIFKYFKSDFEYLLLMRKERSKQRKIDMQKDKRLIMQQCLLQKQLYQLRQLKQRTREGLVNLQADSKKYQQDINYYENKHINASIKLQQLQSKQESMIKNNFALEKQLDHLQSIRTKYAVQVDNIRKKYLLINNQIILDQQGSEVKTVVKKCKFFPSIVQNIYRKFKIQEYLKGFLVTKICNQIGFTKISNQIAYPNEGVFQSIFQIKQILRNEIILGIISKNSPNQLSQSFNLLYFNFRNKSIEYNGVQLKSFECQLFQGHQVRLIINMNDKVITGMVDDYFQQSLNFSAYQISQQSVYLFIALSNDKTVLYFQNS